MNITPDQIDKWATDKDGPVALHLKQILTSVECIDPEEDDCIVYPPTYADIGYSIDVLGDGTKVALIDSIGSQANRMEPFFKSESEDLKDWLVPQIKIAIGEKPEIEDENQHRETRSLLDIAHRGADAVVQSCKELGLKLSEAFTALKETGNAEQLATIAPTSLVFGVWDSRGGSNEKRPRLVRSVIRASGVEVLHSAAQFNSVWKALDEKQKDQLAKEAKKQKVKLSVKGFADAPGVFRNTKVPQVRNGEFNPEARVLGGVLVNGKITRDVTINLVALRGLNAGENTGALRKYLLGLTLTAATADIDLFLREGCQLRFLNKDQWREIPRRGDPREIDLSSKNAQNVIVDYAENSVVPFRKKWNDVFGNKFSFDFDINIAKNLLKQRDDEDEQQ